MSSGAGSDQRTSGPRRRLLGAASVVLTLLVTAGSVTAIVWTRDEALRPARPSSPAIWASVAAAPTELIDGGQQFSIKRSQISDVPAGSWSGVVTALDLTVGRQLDEADPAPIAIDGLGRPWLRGDGPLFRTIGRGLSGSDVDQLAGFLDRTGYVTKHQPGAPSDATMVADIRWWAASHGFDRRAIAFDPAWVTWLPSAASGQPLTTVHLVVGQPAPSLGSPFVSVGGTVTSIVREHAATAGQTTSIAGAIDEVEINGRRFSLADGVLDATGLGELGTLLTKDQTEVSLDVVHVLPTGAVSVDPTSLLPARNGYCMVVSGNNSGTEARAVDVTVVGGTSDAALVADPGRFVLVNPAEQGWTCPS